MNKKTFEEHQNLPKHDIVLFYGKTGNIDYSFREKELTMQSLEDYISKLLERTGPKLLEVTIPAIVYEEFGSEEIIIKGVKVTSQ